LGDVGSNALCQWLGGGSLMLKFETQHELAQRAFVNASGD
jgi:hypothetical protein